jgi:hypothetical protein
MADLPPDVETTGVNGDETRTRPDPGSPPSTPRWVKALGLAVLVLVLVFVILHLAGGGFGGHAPLISFAVPCGDPASATP